MSKQVYSQVSRAKEILEKVQSKGKPVTVSPLAWGRISCAIDELQKIHDELKEKYA